MRTDFAKLLRQIRKGNPEADEALVRKAYRVADKAHQGQLRLSGDPYITHCLAVANILAGLRVDMATLSAALLHDVLEDTQLTLSELKSDFSEDIASLVDGVTKIGTMHKAPIPPTLEEKQAENLRKMLVATAKDVRVILIKLADRLHNLRTIEFLPEHKIQRICRETLDIYSPLANRLGLSNWKWEMEDYAFHHIHPTEYKEVARRVAMKRREREAALNKTMEYLENELRAAEVDARVTGRTKHLYSIYQKMLRQGKTFDQVLDMTAIRIIAPTVSECYNALGLVHHLWTPVAGRFKDYIATPKLNMYRSIHTTVMREGGMTLEVQIRTEDMDRTAQEGIAAHWNYKDGTGRVDETAENQLQWLRQMYDWLKDAHAPDELFDSLRRDIGMTAVYAYTPKGEVKEFPLGATPLDFAYMIHSDVGHHCIGSRVNGSMVPLRYNLQTGDVVEILTSKNQTPHIDWLESVVTGRARTRIRQRLRDLGELPPLDGTGPPPDGTEQKAPQPAPKPRPKPASTVRVVDEKTREKLIRIEGAKGMAVQFAKCCQPMPGHAVIGYVTKRQGITIHQTGCSLLAKTDRDPQREVRASWEGDETIETAMRVSLRLRPNVLADITNAMRPMNIEITYAEYRLGDRNDSVFIFVFQSTDPSSVDRVKSALRLVPGVVKVAVMPAPETSEAR